MTRGRFITVEGIDGAGKSSHLQWMAEWLEARGHRTRLTREPGGTNLGEQLRGLVLREPMQPVSEVLLMFAARREHLAQVIEPALEAGTWVVSDRFTDATFAYQGYGRGVPLERIRQLEAWIQDGLQPDLTILFDIPPAVARTRSEGRAPADRIEAERAEFFDRVRLGYLERARAEPHRFRVIDAGLSLADVRVKLEETLSNYCI